MFVTVDHCKKIIQAYLQNSGRGGFMTGTVASTSPFVVSVGTRLELNAANSYITDSCIGLKVNGQELRAPLRPGDGVLILCRPDVSNGVKYIILDRIQTYKPVREVSM